MADRWNHVEFAQQLAQLKLAKDRDGLKAHLKQVAESNYSLRTWWPTPRTVPVSFKDCAQFSPPGGKGPVISFSKMDTIEALMKFGRERGRSVCALNYANGKDVGGGYKNGATAQEEDLCRCMPTLYSSLFNASKEGLYPFGPPTCTSKDKPEKYCDVLYTLGLTIARAGPEDGYRILKKEEQIEASLVAAAAPNIKFSKDVNDEELIYQTIQTIFISPQIAQEGVNTLILGAWGCGAFGGDPVQIAGLFIKAMLQDNLGQPYKEIHFAIPETTPDDVNYDTFRKVFDAHKIQVVHM
eukprot:TRINITY_DN13459_c0_g1_i1.p1 TRINITY_DN13459_c0_g1~~TRINITY_DN13459_c0_g1_i1.p1  ORF type:complete len:297 (-),score=59.21 TRINITY_DN13459_c0_g1_i1:168-1058(-)